MASSPFGRGEFHKYGQPAAGCVGGLNGPAHRIDESFRDGETEADAGGVVLVAEPLERREQLLCRAARYTGPSSVTAISTRPPTVLAVTRTGLSGA